jgi:GNAT superfamily N-acetyltransferase
VRAGARSGVPLSGLRYRTVAAEELPACAGIWRTSINHYIVPMGQPEIAPEFIPLLRLYAHLQATDPERFVVATVPDDGRERLVAFASAVVRERFWYLSMLFVLPEFQGAGLGRALLRQVLPHGDTSARGTATDSAQPISNALYASYGLVPRMPFLNLIGLPERPEAFEPLPSGVVPIPFGELLTGASGDGRDGGSQGHAMLVQTIDELDRELLGFAHPLDHRFLRSEGRRGWLYRGPDGGVLGYGYAGEAGRIGPIAVRDAALLGPVLGHLTSAVVPRGAFAFWVAGAADRAIVPALQAGFRLDPFPVLLCWDRPFADFSRYLPIGTGLL